MMTADSNQMKRFFFFTPLTLKISKPPFSFLPWMEWVPNVDDFFCFPMFPLSLFPLFFSYFRRSQETRSALVDRRRNTKLAAEQPLGDPPPSLLCKLLELYSFPVLFNLFKIACLIAGGIACCIQRFFSVTLLLVISCAVVMYCLLDRGVFNLTTVMLILTSVIAQVTVFHV